MSSARAMNYNQLLSDRRLKCMPQGIGMSASATAEPSRVAPLVYQIEVPWRGIAINVMSDDKGVDWLRQLAERLECVLRLPENWNSYGARKIDPLVVIYAIESVLPEFMDDATPLPVVTPTPDGGVAFEWHERDIDLEIAVRKPGRVSVMYEDARDGTEWEREVGSNLKWVADLVAELRRRG